MYGIYVLLQKVFVINNFSRSFLAKNKFIYPDMQQFPKN